MVAIVDVVVFRFVVKQTLLELVGWLLLITLEVRKLGLAMFT